MKIALIAGTGALPVLLAERLCARGQAPLVAALEGTTTSLPVDRRFRLEGLSPFLDGLVAAGITHVVMAGAVRRPTLDAGSADPSAPALAARLAAALRLGDDGALGALIAIIEDHGLTVIGAHDLVPELLPAPGIHSRRQPDRGHDADARRGADIVAAMATADIGQACVVSAGQALAVEALPGTDAMLATLAPRPAGLPPGGLLYKAPKPGQDRRADLPVIGPGTVQAARAAGLDGIVIAASGVMVPAFAATLAAADSEGMFLWVRPA